MKEYIIISLTGGIILYWIMISMIITMQTNNIYPCVYSGVGAVAYLLLRGFRG